jgi:hypothetical protein
MRLFNFQSWLDHKLKNDIYELKGEEIIRGRGRAAGTRVGLAEIVSWWIYHEMGFDLVTIELSDGNEVRWIDKYNDLIGILRRVAREKERASPS